MSNNKIGNNYSPVANKQEYIWFAKYNNGEIVYEYDDDKHETMFDYLEKNGITSFGLIGNGISFSFDIETGNYYINDLPLKISISIDGKSLDISGKKDIIQFKSGYTDAIRNKNRKFHYTRTIEAYSIGYKMNIQDATRNIYLQLILCIPVAGKYRIPFIAAKINSSNNGECIIRINNNINTIELEAGKSSLTKLKIG